MMRNFFSAGVFVAAIVLISCNGTTGGNEQGTAEGSVKSLPFDSVSQYYAPEDSAAVVAYLNDKSTILPRDIDPGDSIYATKNKVLYRGATDNVAVIFAFKSDVKAPGVALVQVNTEKPLQLPQLENDESGNQRFSDGNTTLIRDLSGDFVYIADGQTSVQYGRIK